MPLQFEIDGARSELTVDMEGPEFELKNHPIPLATDQKRGWGRVSIPADENPADNEFYFVYDEPPPRHTMLVAEDPQAVRAQQLAAEIAAIRRSRASREVVDPADLARRRVGECGAPALAGAAARRRCRGTGALVRRSRRRGDFLSADQSRRHRIFRRRLASMGNARRRGLGRNLAWRSGFAVPHAKRRRAARRRTARAAVLRIERRSSRRWRRLHGGCAAVGRESPPITVAFTSAATTPRRAIRRWPPTASCSTWPFNEPWPAGTVSAGQHAATGRRANLPLEAARTVETIAGAGACTFDRISGSSRRVCRRRSNCWPSIACEPKISRPSLADAASTNCFAGSISIESMAGPAAHVAGARNLADVPVRHDGGNGRRSRFVSAQRGDAVREGRSNMVNSAPQHLRFSGRRLVVVAIARSLPWLSTAASELDRLAAQRISPLDRRARIVAVSARAAGGDRVESAGMDRRISAGRNADDRRAVGRFGEHGHARCGCECGRQPRRSHAAKRLRR